LVRIVAGHVTLSVLACPREGAGGRVACTGNRRTKIREGMEPGVTGVFVTISA